MKTKMNVIAFYLPQFHEIPENNQWWGKGFTEWVNVKNATPLFKGHNQPRIPLGGNYYDLSNNDTIRWQVKIAKENGITGFCFYHYWFNGKLLLEKPVENFLKDADIDIDFCISWANETWTKAWSGKQDSVLIKQEYGGPKEWKEHFDYLYQFFMDNRYIKEDGKPLLIIYRPDLIPNLNEMLDCWNQLAISYGLKGMTFVYQHVSFYLLPQKDDSRFQYYIQYQPGFIRAVQDKCSTSSKIRRLIVKSLKSIESLFRIELRNVMPQKVRIFDYDKTWEKILSIKPDEKSLPGAFVDWDNTPRRKNRGMIYCDSTPESFHKYFSRLIKKTVEEYKKNYIFIFAWNEWAEGGYLEPDEKYKFGYLNAVKDSLKENSINND